MFKPSLTSKLGWEPIFEHNGETLAEMELDKKVNKWSIGA